MPMTQLLFRFLTTEKPKSTLSSDQVRRAKSMAGAGKSLRQIAANIGVDHCRLWRELRILKIPLKRRHLTARERQDAIRMLLDDEPQSSIARTLGKHKSTINRLAMSQRRLSEGVQFQGARRRVCPKHGAVNVWPCVACKAEQYREQRNLR